MEPKTAQHKQKPNRSYGNPETELRRILEMYPKLSVDDVTLFARVYYPVALVEFEMEEKSFEDFETIQKTVMQLIAAGVNDVRTIADTLCLTPDYIDGMVNRFLTGRGLIRDGSLTDLGRESLRQDNLLAQVTVRELFYIDALEGNLLRLPELVSEEKLRMRDNTDIAVGHLNLIDGVPASMLTDQLEKSGLSRYIAGKKQTEILAINRIDFKELKYAEAYMIGIRGFSRPVIFAKRSPDPEDENDRHGKWLPFSVENARQRALLGLDSSVELTGEAARRYVDSILEQLDGAAQSAGAKDPSRTTENTVQKLMQEKYLLNLSRTPPPKKSGRLRTYSLTKAAFTGFNNKSLSLLADIGTQGRALVTAPRFYGVTLSFITHDKDILAAAGALSQKLSAVRAGALMDYLCGRLSDGAPDPFERLITLLNDYDPKEAETES